MSLRVAISFLLCISVLQLPLSGRQAAVTPAATVVRDPQSVALLGQALSVAGGIENLLAIQDFSATGNITYFWAGEQASGTVTLRQAGIDHFRLDAALPQGTRSWVVSAGKGILKNFDGTSALIPNQSALSLGALGFPQLRMAATLNDTSSSIRSFGQVTLGERQAYAIHTQRGSFSTGNLTTIDYFIDLATCQLLLVRDTSGPQGSIIQQVRHDVEYSDYRLFNGVLFPLRITEKLNDQTTWTIQVSSIALNTGLTESNFIL